MLIHLLIFITVVLRPALSYLVPLDGATVLDKLDLEQHICILEETFLK